MSNKDDLKRLKKIWYKKLADEGFEDIEQDEANLKRWDSRYFISNHTSFQGASKRPSRTNDGEASTNAHPGEGLNTLQFTSQQEYYQLAGVFLHEHTFESGLEYQIWDMHSQGIPGSRIKEKLKRRKVSLETIYKITKKLAAIMVGQCQPLKKT